MLIDNLLETLPHFPDDVHWAEAQENGTIDRIGSTPGIQVRMYEDDIQCVVRAENVAALALGDARGLADMPCLRLPFKGMWLEWARSGIRYGCLAIRENDGPEFSDAFFDVYSCVAGQVFWEGHEALLMHPDGALDQLLMSPGQNGKNLTSMGREILRIACLTICLMHCKNVTAEEHCPPAPLQKARQKRGKRPLFRYHVLNIESMAKVLRKDGGLGSGNGLAQALHICRGHFKDYRQSGLFGKVKGIFWWDHHVRGDVKQGVVVKDYSIGPPT